MAARKQPRAMFGVALLLGCMIILASQTGLVSAVPLVDGIVYVVQPGDRLADIASRYGVSVSTLAQANGLSDSNTILAGQRLTIPAASISTPAPAATGVNGAGQATHYIVQRGDTLASIARKYGVSVAALQQANSLRNPDIIWAGQKLLIPGVSTVATETPVPTPQPTETSSVLVQPATEATPTSQPTPQPSPTALPTTTKPPTAQPAAKPSVPKSHTVQAGETLSQIARLYGVSVDALVATNHLASADLIYAGMRLTIPANGSSSSSTTTSGATTSAPKGKATKFVASISEQRCWLYSGTTVIAKWVCSTGRKGAGTKVGTFRIQSKMEKAYGSTWNIWMPYWLGIYWAGASENGIHGLPWNASTGVQIWSGNVGTPITFGCIMLNNTHAKMLYDMAYIGMPVVIRP